MKLTGIRRVFVLGDLHLGVKNNSMEWSDIQREFLLDHFLAKVDEIGFDPETDILIQVGDWHHVRESTNTRVFKLSLEVAKKFTSKFKRGVFVILGNHDVYYKDRTDTHSLECFPLMYENFRVFEEPSALQLDSHKFLMLPWIEDVAALKQQVSLNSSASHVFCHADVRGSILNAFTKLEHGLDLTDLSSFKRVYSGHIHIRQERGNVLYVGTPYEMDRGDRGNTKGFWVLDLEKDRVTERFIENQVSPRHLKLDVTQVLNLSIEELSSLFKNNYVDISIESGFSSRFPLTAFTELVKELGQRRVEFFSYSRDQEKSKSEIELDSNYEYNIFTVLESHLKGLNLSPSQSEPILTRFREIYDSLRNSKKYEQ